MRSKLIFKVRILKTKSAYARRCRKLEAHKPKGYSLQGVIGADDDLSQPYSLNESLKT